MSPEKRNSFEKDLRSMQYKEFVVKLLDSRHNLEQRLTHQRTHHYASYTGYKADTYQAPIDIVALLPGPLSDATLDFSVDEEKKSISISNLTISSDNHDPIFLHQDEELGLAVAEQGNEIIALDKDALHDILASFLPRQPREQPSVKKLTEFLGTFSPQKDELSIFFGKGDGFMGEIRFSDIETVDNSIQVLEIVNRKRHVSGVTIGTRLRITESLLMRMHESRSQGVNQSLDINTTPVNHEPVITVEQLINDEGRTVRVVYPTQNHIDDIQAVIRLLNAAQP